MHQVLVEYHKAALEELSKTTGRNETAFVEQHLQPTSALLSYWGPQTPGYGGAIHMSRAGPIPAQELASHAMAPFGDQVPLYVANEAFGALRGSDGSIGSHHGWAECSLVMAENLLTAKFGMKPPDWMNATVYDEYVTFHSEERQVARRGGWHQG